MRMMKLRMMMSVVIFPATVSLLEGTTNWTVKVSKRKMAAIDLVMGAMEL